MTKQKVGILTFHYTDNPGSVLQAYALQRTINELGAECEIINYQKAGWEKATYLNYLPYMRRKFGLLGYMVWFGFIPVLKLRLFQFTRFQKKYIKQNSKSRVSRKTICNLHEYYDKFVAGSDQVWNYNNVKVDDTYFLDFLDNSEQKVAYAPSFGVEELSVIEEKRLELLLKNMKYISVREKHGQKIIEKITGAVPELVLDPTLLMDAEKWIALADKPDSENYIYVYLRKISPSIARFVTELSRLTGLPIIQVTGLRKRVLEGKCVKNPSPEKWLGYLINAKYVVTNSFHGVAFSINMNKQFFVEPMRGPQEETNSRLYSLLDQFGLQDRMISEESSNINNNLIDYKTVNALLREKRQHSLHFLNSALFGVE